MTRKLTRIMREAATRLGAVAVALAASDCASAAHPPVPRFNADLTITSNHTWRGTLLSNRLALQPRAWFNTGPFSLGAWSLVEPLLTRDNDVSVRGNRRAFPSQLEAWGELRLNPFDHPLRIGLAGSRFLGDTRGITHRASGGDWYATLEPRSETPIVESWWYRARYWHGIGSWRTRYADVEVGKQIFVLPIKDISITPTLGAGYNFSRWTPTPPFQRIDDGRSWTHLQAGVRITPSERCDHSRWMWIPDLAITHEWPKSRTARRSGPASESNGILTFEANLWPRFCAARR